MIKQSGKSKEHAATKYGKLSNLEHAKDRELSKKASSAKIRER